MSGGRYKSKERPILTRAGSTGIDSYRNRNRYYLELYCDIDCPIASETTMNTRHDRPLRVFVRYRSDLSASAVLYAHDRYCRGLGRVLVFIIHRPLCSSKARVQRKWSCNNHFCSGPAIARCLQ